MTADIIIVVLNRKKLFVENSIKKFLNVGIRFAFFDSITDFLEHFLFFCRSKTVRRAHGKRNGTGSDDLMEKKLDA